MIDHLFYVIFKFIEVKVQFRLLLCWLFVLLADNSIGGVFPTILYISEQRK